MQQTFFVNVTTLLLLAFIANPLTVAAENPVAAALRGTDPNVIDEHNSNNDDPEEDRKLWGCQNDVVVGFSGYTPDGRQFNGLRIGGGVYIGKPYDWSNDKAVTPGPHGGQFTIDFDLPSKLQSLVLRKVKGGVDIELVDEHHNTVCSWWGGFGERSKWRAYIPFDKPHLPCVSTRNVKWVRITCSDECFVDNVRLWRSCY